MAYGVVHTTNLSGCDCYDFQSTIDTENGALVTKGNPVTYTSGSTTWSERNIYEAVIPKTETLSKEPVYLVANPAWNYESYRTVDQNEENYINKAGTVFRVYELKPNKRFKLTDYSIDPIDASTPLAENQYVGLQADSTRLKASAAMPTGSAFIGVIRAIDDSGFPFCVGSGGVSNGDLGFTVGETVKMVLIEVVQNHG